MNDEIDEKILTTGAVELDEFLQKCKGKHGVEYAKLVVRGYLLQMAILQEEDEVKARALIDKSAFQMALGNLQFPDVEASEVCADLNEFIQIGVAVMKARAEKDDQLQVPGSN